ncbi:hypothetical protein QFC20_004736 [Naganishia adeliensis]|uniref:Uncharacterized protein n=1 Tax=Naganishia adeliensis TaxID=92952 RepID=A0ACC2VWW6_9TREE|nr:hypothetical protein QFC20_004736 [Naganishia adeliensis]
MPHLAASPFQFEPAVLELDGGYFPTMLDDTDVFEDVDLDSEYGGEGDGNDETTNGSVDRMRDAKLEPEGSRELGYASKTSRTRLEEERSNKGSSVSGQHYLGTLYIAFPSPDLPQTPPRTRTLSNTETDSPNQPPRQSFKRGETDPSSISSWYSAESDPQSPSVTVLCTPSTPLDTRLHPEGKENTTPEPEDATPSFTPRIIVTRPSTDRLFDWFPHMFTNSPQFSPRHFSYADDQEHITLEFEPVNRPVARVIQYEREPVEPLGRDSITFPAAMRDQGLVGLGLGLEDPLDVRSQEGDQYGVDSEEACLVDRRGYIAVVREMNNIFSAQGISGGLELFHTARLSVSSMRPTACMRNRRAPAKLEHPTTVASSSINDSITTSSIIVSPRSNAMVPVEMIPLKITDGSPPSTRALKKRRSTTILKAKSSMDRLSRVFAEGFNKTISAFSSPGARDINGLEADIENYRSKGLGSPLRRWNGASAPTTPFSLRKKGSQESGFSWSPSLLRRPRLSNGEDQSVNAPSTLNKTLRSLIPRGKKGLLPIGRSRCDSEESWGNVPLHIEQKNEDGREISRTIVDLGQREACEYGLRTVPSLRLLRSGAAWGAMRTDIKQDASSIRRSTSPSGSSLSLSISSISDSSMTMYASHIPSPDALDDEARYKQIARMEALALLEGKVERRESLAWCEMRMEGMGERVQ